MTNEAPELLPCPFCGGLAIDRHQNITADYMECSTCGAFGPNEDCNGQSATNWNRRADLARPKVKPGELERIVWAAMIWARENTSPDSFPEYTDGGNSFAEDECRATVRRILSALEGQGDE